MSIKKNSIENHEIIESPQKNRKQYNHNNSNRSKGIHENIQQQIFSPSKENQGMIKILQHKLKILVESNYLPSSYFQQFKKSVNKNSKKLQNQQQNFKRQGRFGYIQYQYQKQISKLENDNSYGQKINFLLEQRSMVLKQLKTLLVKQKIPHKSNSTKNLPFNLSYIAENLSKLRDIALRIIQHLALWKSWMNSQQSDQYSRQILSSITNDCQFLRISPLRKFLQFSSTSDPLFLHSLRKFWKLQLSTNYNARPILDLFQVKDQYKKRLLNAQQFLKTFLPSSITRNFPIQQYNKIQAQNQVIEENNSEINPSTLINSQKFNLPSIQKNQNSRIHRKTKIKQQQKPTKIEQLLKPIIDEAKNKKLAKRVLDSINSYQSPQKQKYQPQYKLKSYTVNKYDNFSKNQNPSMSLNKEDHLNHRKYRLMTETHYKNIDSIEEKLDKIGMEGKHRVIKKIKNKQSMLTPNSVSRIMSKQEIFLNNPNNQAEPQNMVQMQGSNKVSKYSRMPNKNIDRNASSKQTIKITHFNNKTQPFSNQKEGNRDGLIRRDQLLLNKKKYLKSLKKNQKIVHGMEKYFQTQNSELEIQNDQSNPKNEQVSNIIRYKNNTNTQREKQLERAFQRYQKLEKQDSLNQNQHRKGEKSPTRNNKDQDRNRYYRQNSQKAQGKNYYNPDEMRNKKQKQLLNIINDYNQKQKADQIRKSPYEQLPRSLQRQIQKKRKAFQIPDKIKPKSNTKQPGIYKNTSDYYQVQNKGSEFKYDQNIQNQDNNLEEQNQELMKRLNKYQVNTQNQKASERQSQKKYQDLKNDQNEYKNYVKEQKFEGGKKQYQQIKLFNNQKIINSKDTTSSYPGQVNQKDHVNNNIQGQKSSQFSHKQLINQNKNQLAINKAPSDKYQHQIKSSQTKSFTAINSKQPKLNDNINIQSLQLQNQYSNNNKHPSKNPSLVDVNSTPNNKQSSQINPNKNNKPLQNYKNELSQQQRIKLQTIKQYDNQSYIQESSCRNNNSPVIKPMNTQRSLNNFNLSPESNEQNQIDSGNHKNRFQKNKQLNGVDSQVGKNGEKSTLLNQTKPINNPISQPNSLISNSSQSSSINHTVQNSKNSSPAQQTHLNQFQKVQNKVQSNSPSNSNTQPNNIYKDSNNDNNNGQNILKTNTLSVQGKREENPTSSNKGVITKQTERQLINNNNNQKNANNKITTNSINNTTATNPINNNLNTHNSTISPPTTNQNQLPSGIINNSSKSSKNDMSILSGTDNNVSNKDGNIINDRSHNIGNNLDSNHNTSNNTIPSNNNVVNYPVPTINSKSKDNTTKPITNDFSSHLNNPTLNVTSKNIQSSSNPNNNSNGNNNIIPSNVNSSSNLNDNNNKNSNDPNLTSNNSANNDTKLIPADNTNSNNTSPSTTNNGVTNISPPIAISNNNMKNNQFSPSINSNSNIDTVNSQKNKINITNPANQNINEKSNPLTLTSSTKLQKTVQSKLAATQQQQLGSSNSKMQNQSSLNNNSLSLPNSNNNPNNIQPTNINNINNSNSKNNSDQNSNLTINKNKQPTNDQNNLTTQPPNKDNNNSANIAQTTNPINSINSQNNLLPNNSKASSITPSNNTILQNSNPNSTAHHKNSHQILTDKNNNPNDNFSIAGRTNQVSQKKVSDTNANEGSLNESTQVSPINNGNASSINASQNGVNVAQTNPSRISNNIKATQGTLNTNNNQSFIGGNTQTSNTVNNLSSPPNLLSNPQIQSSNTIKQPIKLSTNQTATNNINQISPTNLSAQKKQPLQHQQKQNPPLTTTRQQVQNASKQQNSLLLSQIRSQVSNNATNTKNKQQIQALTKCIFQTRSFKTNQLSAFLKSHKIHQKIIEQISTKYFSHRHLTFNLCWLNNQIISCVLSHPTFAFNQRIVVVVLFKVLSPKYQQFSTKLFATTIRYLFFNDPCESVVCLKLKSQLQDDSDRLIQKGLVKELKNIKGRIKHIFKQQKQQVNVFSRSSPVIQYQSVFDDNAYFISRKQLPCKNDQYYLNVIQVEISIIGKPNLKIPQKIGRLQFSQSNRAGIDKTFIQNDQTLNTIKKFTNKSSLIQYLEQQQLSTLLQSKSMQSIKEDEKQLYFYQRLICNLNPGIKYTCYCGVYYFLLEQNKAYYWQKNNVGFLFLKCQTKNLQPANTPSLTGSQVSSSQNIKTQQFYYVFIDYIYESDQLVNASQMIKQFIEQKDAKQVLRTDSEFINKVVTVPCFQSQQVIDNFKSDNFIAHTNMNLSWKNYIKGVRSISEQQTLAQFIAPFYFGLIMKDKSNVMRSLCGQHINKEQEKIQE